MGRRGNGRGGIAFWLAFILVGAAASVCFMCLAAGVGCLLSLMR